MNYQKIYDQLIQNRKNNRLSKKDCYCEEHHIIPLSEGGPDTKDNKVNLSAREHYIAHLLLAKIYDDFNFDYFTIGNIFENTENKITILLSGTSSKPTTITIKYNPIIKDVPS